jgi:predicted MFS family arabinose efflux permease
MISMPVASAYVADLAPANQRGLYMGTYGLVWSVASICGPSLGMLLFSLNHSALWLICGAVGTIAAGIIFLDARPVAASTSTGAPSPASSGS